MRSKLVYLIAGIIISASVFVGAGLLRGQSATYSGPKWEYIAVALAVKFEDPKKPITTLEINDEKVDFTGSVPDLFNKLGSEGWEYAGGLAPYLFKRPLAS